jgi:hypothetical protein
MEGDGVDELGLAIAWLGVAILIWIGLISLIIKLWTIYGG